MKERKEVMVGLMGLTLRMRNTGRAVDLDQKAEFRWDVSFEMPIKHPRNH